MRSRIVTSYLSPRVLSNDSDAHKDAISSVEPEILLEGPARCGKTGSAIRKGLALHAKNYGMRSCVARMNATDLTRTVKYDIRELFLRYGFEDPRSQIKQQGGLSQFHTLRVNGGYMNFGGMNRPSSVLGSHYSFVHLNELSEFTEDAYMTIKTRCSGSAPEWRSKDGRVLFQMLSDTNPTVEDFWAYKREAKGLIRTIKYDFIDNPFFYRKGRWSRVGRDLVNEYDRSLTGIWRDIYFLGKRVAPEGMVFRIHPKNIIKYSDLPPLSECTLYRACDWGQQHPSVCLWIAEHKETRNVYVYREWRQTRSDILIMGQDVNRFSEGEEIEATVIDHDGNRQSILQTLWDIPTVLAPKGGNSVMDGLFLLQSALRNAVEERDGGLYIVDPEDGLICSPVDPNPEAKDLAQHIIDEMRHLKFHLNRDMPEKEGDDAVDALRYWFLWRYRHTEIDLPVILGRVNLHQKRSPLI